MENKTILITGIHGFIGSYLSATLQSSFPTARVFGLSRYESPKEPHILAADLLKKDALYSVFERIQPDYIFHLAGVIYSQDWTQLYAGNVEATINLLEAVKGHALSTRIIIPGSAAEYGRILAADLPLTEMQPPNPVSPYGVTKVWQTTLAKYYTTHGLDMVVGRMFNIIGRGAPEGLSIGAFASQLRRIKIGELPPKIMVGNLKPKRDFLDIFDACMGLITLATNGRSGEVYNICSGNSVSMEYILNKMVGFIGIEVEVIVDPSRLKRADIEDIFGTNQKIQAETGWSPTVPLDISIEKVVN